MTSLVLFVFMCGFVSIGQTNQDLFTPCQRSLPIDQLTACLTDQARRLQPTISSGLTIGDLTLPPLDPLSLTDVSAKTGTFTIKSTNVVVKGIENAEIREIKWDLQKKEGVTKLYGNFTFLSDYETGGTFALIPINGNGKLTVKLYNSEMLFRYKYKTVKDEVGNEHIQVYDSKSSTKYGKVKLHLSNFLGGELISRTVNQVLNDNWRTVMTEVGPPFTRAVADRVHTIINQFYYAVPISELFAE